MKKEVEIKDKYSLTVEEAALYFRIGENKLRALIAENPRAEYLLYNGNRVQIKRKKFEDYLDSIDFV